MLELTIALNVTICGQMTVQQLGMLIISKKKVPALYGPATPLTMPKKSPSTKAAGPSLKAIKARTDHVINAACLLFNLDTRVEPLDNKLETPGKSLVGKIPPACRR
jgi:hypothetical protein